MPTPARPQLPFVLHFPTSHWQDESDGGLSTEAAAGAAATALDELRRLVHTAERERGIDLLESFEHFDRRGQVPYVGDALQNSRLKIMRGVHILPNILRQTTATGHKFRLTQLPFLYPLVSATHGITAHPCPLNRARSLK